MTVVSLFESDFLFNRLLLLRSFLSRCYVKEMAKISSRLCRVRTPVLCPSPPFSVHTRLWTSRSVPPWTSFSNPPPVLQHKKVQSDNLWQQIDNRLATERVRLIETWQGQAKVKCSGFDLSWSYFCLHPIKKQQGHGKGRYQEKK